MKNDSEVIDPIKTGKFIKKLRSMHNLTQEELADKIFITRKAISKWETGKGCPSLDVLKRLSKELGVTVDELIEGKFIDPQNSNATENIKTLHKILKSRLFKISIIVCMVLSFLSLLIFYFENQNSLKVYTMNYESNGITLKNGIIVISRAKKYYNFGYFYNDAKDVDDNTKYDMNLYIKKKNGKKLKLLSYTYNQSNYIEKYRYDELSDLNIKNNLDNFYLKIEYYNTKGIKKVQNLNLNIDLDYESDFNYEFKEKDNIENNKDFNNKSKNFKNKGTEYIDISFLYKLDSKSLKNKFYNI